MSWITSTIFVVLAVFVAALVLTEWVVRRRARMPQDGDDPSPLS